MIITGAGRAFVAGADITELESQNPLGMKALARRGQLVFNRLESMPKPVIAAVNGFALGGGCELAMACHIRIASDAAKFGQPEVKLGLVPGYGGTQRLARLIGKGRALQLLLTGEMIDAQEAFRIGLVNRVVPAAEVVSAATATARTSGDHRPRGAPFRRCQDHTPTLSTTAGTFAACAANGRRTIASVKMASAATTVSSCRVRVSSGYVAGPTSDSTKRVAGTRIA